MIRWIQVVEKREGPTYMNESILTPLDRPHVLSQQSANSLSCALFSQGHPLLGFCESTCGGCTTARTRALASRATYGGLQLFDGRFGTLVQKFGFFQRQCARRAKSHRDGRLAVRLEVGDARPLLHLRHRCVRLPRPHLAGSLATQSW